MALFVAYGPGALAQPQGLVQADSGRASFLKWAKESFAPLSSTAPGAPEADLAPFGRMIGDATLVALSEGVHFAAEPLQFRDRVVQYLVEEKGFTAIAIESGIVESRVVHDYVRGEAGDLQTVVAAGVGWTFDRLPQNQALVRWLRDYNADPRHVRKVNFYGFDVPGSPGNADAKRGPDAALVEALNYLTRVDRSASAVFHARVESLLPNLRFDLHRSPSAHGYDRLSQIERDALTAAIADLVTLFERRQAQYIVNSTVGDYEWAYRAAVGARQVDNWLRQVPLGWRPSRAQGTFPSEQTRFLSVATDVRDRAQADNIEWIVRREGRAAKVLVFAHRYHVSAAPVKTGFWLPDGADQHRQQTAGTYLRRRFGKRFISIGNLIAAGEIGCGGFKRTLEPALRESIEAVIGAVGVPRLLLDLRTAPAAASSWLDREQRVGQGHEALTLAVGQAFDVLFYLDTVTPACGVH